MEPDIQPQQTPQPVTPLSNPQPVVQPVPAPVASPTPNYPATPTSTIPYGPPAIDTATAKKIKDSGNAVIFLPINPAGK